MASEINSLAGVYPSGVELVGLLTHIGLLMQHHYSRSPRLFKLLRRFVSLIAAKMKVSAPSW